VNPTTATKKASDVTASKVEVKKRKVEVQARDAKVQAEDSKYSLAHILGSSGSTEVISMYLVI
jgi:hypothetical protein